MNSKKRTFVDIGAADGVSINNTLFFEFELNWNGLCIEAIPEQFEILVRNRNCHCENACIGATKKEVSFLVVTKCEGCEKFGIDSSLLSGRLDTWESERKQILHTTENEIITLSTTPLHEILQKHDFTHIDYLSVDVEGAELEVLESIDWDRTTICVIDIENNCNKEDGVRALLRKKGYLMVARLWIDDVWVKPEYILEHFPSSPVAGYIQSLQGQQLSNTSYSHQVLEAQDQLISPLHSLIR